MSRYAPVVALVAVLATACSSVNVEQERNALLQRDREWSQTTKDVDRFLAFLTPDASLYPPGSPVTVGTDAIRTMFAAMSAAPGFALEWTPTKGGVSGAGDVGYTAGTYTARMAGSTEKGKYVTLWRKDAGAWKVTDDIFNADGPGPVPEHAMVAASELKWGDAPPSLPPGARTAVVSGDPTQPVPFVIRAQMPAGYRVPPHWHPTTENLTVISGTVALGMGDAPDAAAMKELPVGGFAALPAEMRHTFMAKTAATIQVHGMGPFAVTYVNPADDPRNKK